MQIALAKRPAKAFMSETSRCVTNKPWNPGLTEGHDASMRCASRDAQGIEPDPEMRKLPNVGPRNRRLTRLDLSQSTESGPSQRKEVSIKSRPLASQRSEGPAVRTVYEQFQQAIKVQACQSMMSTGRNFCHTLIHTAARRSCSRI
jgi:hypothetical protein